MDLSRLNCMKPLISRRSRRNDGNIDDMVFKRTFTVKYIGTGRLEQPGLTDMCNFIKAMFKDKPRTFRKYPKSEVTMGDGELSIISVPCSIQNATAESRQQVFNIRRIQFCGVYQANPKIFFFTYQFGKTAESVDCHILKCKSKKEAKSLAKEARILFKDIAFSLHRRSDDKQVTKMSGDYESSSGTSSAKDFNQDFILKSI